jgi:hypothetical protein
MLWLFGLIIFAIFLWVSSSNEQKKIKEKALQDSEREYNLNELISEVKSMLNEKKYLKDFVPPEIDYFSYLDPDKTIGNCPKCKNGYLGIGKTFTGMDVVYNRYPTYHKFLRCSSCGYTENYANLKSRRTNTRSIASAQFKKDFANAYFIN